MATLADLQTDLAAVRAARTALLTGTPLTRLTVGGVDKTYMTLKDLAGEENRIERAIGSVRGGGRNYAAF